MYQITITKIENGVEITRKYADEYFENSAEKIGEDIKEMQETIKNEEGFERRNF